MKNTLCWNCKRACGGCPWSMSGTAAGVTRTPAPVDGWQATKTRLRMPGTKGGRNDNLRTVVSYIVEKCPLFSPDGRATSA